MKDQELTNLSIKIKTVLDVLIVPIIAFGVYLLKDMNSNIQELNTQVAVILTEGHHNKEKIKDIEVRLRDLEKGIK